MKCEACKKFMGSNTPDKIRCGKCNRNYHYQCLGISQEGYNELLKVGQVLTKCPACSSNKCINSPSTPTRSTLHAYTSVATLSPQHSIDQDGIEIKTSSIAQSQSVFLEEIKSIIKKEINSHLSTFKSEILDKINNLTESVNFISNEFDNFKLKINDCQTKIDKYESTRDELASCKLEIVKLQLDISKQQQWSRMSNIEIVGVPEKTNESPHEIVMNICKYAEVPLKEQDVESANRVQSMQPVKGRPRIIIARLRDRSLKNMIISKLRKQRGITSKDIGIFGEPKQIYVNEHLTQNNKILLRECKEKCKIMCYKFVWVRNCIIYCRKNETSPYILISSFLDLEKII